MARRGSGPPSTLPVLIFICLVITFLCREAAAQAQCDTKRDLHSSSICGLDLGMTPTQVLDAMKQPPDIGQAQQGDIVSGWKLQGGDFLSVQFRKKQYVSTLTLDFHPMRRATDVGLPSAVEDQSAGSSFPYLRRDYHRDETQNSERVIWSREEKNSAGYKEEIGFLSASRLKDGEHVYQNSIATKYITVRKPELAKFDRAMESKPDSSAATGAKR
jgi:hypothetical protein